MTAVEFAAGGFRYIPAVFQYSGGVAASPGFTIRRVRFQRAVPVAAGFAEIARFIKAAGRPLTSFCACELRSPAPFSDDGFRAFNQGYVVTLRDWGIMQDERNPVARSNVCPEIDPPSEPSFHAFCFTVESKDATQFLLGDLFSRDKIRMLRAGLNYDWIDRTGRNFIALSIFQGLSDALGAMESNDTKSSRFGADNRFTKAYLNLVRVQRIVDRVSIILRGAGQATTRPLVAIEEFYIG